eukprot:6173287-Pleurochrysis_carterae.AAC.3
MSKADCHNMPAFCQITLSCLPQTLHCCPVARLTHQSCFNQSLNCSACSGDLLLSLLSLKQTSSTLHIACRENNGSLL